MLILNAGAHKSGSTWVEAIIRQLPITRVRPPPPPPFLTEEPWASKFAAARDMGANRKRKIAYIEWLSQGDIAPANYLVKCHISPDIDRLKIEDFSILNNSDVRIVNIMRDVRDFLVSAYFHRKAFGKIDTLDHFFEKQARKAFTYYMEYNYFWIMEAASRIAAPTLNLSYEGLSENFDGELKRLARFLDVKRPYFAPLIKRRTSLKRMRRRNRRKWMSGFEQQGRGFFRSGSVGDYADHLSPEMLDTVESWRSEERFRALEAARQTLIEQTVPRRRKST